MAEAADGTDEAREAFGRGPGGSSSSLGLSNREISTLPTGPDHQRSRLKRVQREVGKRFRVLKGDDDCVLKKDDGRRLLNSGGLGAVRSLSRIGQRHEVVMEEIYL